MDFIPDAIAEFEKRRHLPATKEDIDALADRLRHMVWGAYRPHDQAEDDELMEIALAVEELKFRIPSLPDASLKGDE